MNDLEYIIDKQLENKNVSKMVLFKNMLEARKQGKNILEWLLKIPNEMISNYGTIDFDNLSEDAEHDIFSCTLYIELFQKGTNEIEVKKDALIENPFKLHVLLLISLLNKFNVIDISLENSENCNWNPCDIGFNLYENISFDDATNLSTHVKDKVYLKKIIETIISTYE